MSNFGDIKSKVADYINRDDLTSVIPDFINFAQRRIERENNFNYMISSSTSLTFSADSDTVTAPTDYKESIWWYLVKNSNKNFLEKHPAGRMETLNSKQTPTSNTPTDFEYRYPNFVINPPADTTYTNKLLYYALSADLSSDSDTNFLTDKIPEVLIYGALMEAEVYLVNDPRWPTWQTQYRIALNQLRSMENSESWFGRVMERV